MMDVFKKIFLLAPMMGLVLSACGTRDYSEDNNLPVRKSTNLDQKKLDQTTNQPKAVTWKDVRKSFDNYAAKNPKKAAAMAIGAGVAGGGITFISYLLFAGLSKGKKEKKEEKKNDEGKKDDDKGPKNPPPESPAPKGPSGPAPTGSAPVEPAPSTPVVDSTPVVEPAPVHGASPLVLIKLELPSAGHSTDGGHGSAGFLSNARKIGTRVVIAGVAVGCAAALWNIGGGINTSVKTSLNDYFQGGAAIEAPAIPGQ